METKKKKGTDMRCVHVGDQEKSRPYMAQYVKMCLLVRLENSCALTPAFIFKKTVSLTFPPLHLYGSERLHCHTHLNVAVYLLQ